MKWIYLQVLESITLLEKKRLQGHLDLTVSEHIKLHCKGQLEEQKLHFCLILESFKSYFITFSQGLLEQDNFHCSLMACCLEIIIFSYNSQR